MMRYLKAIAEIKAKADGFLKPVFCWFHVKPRNLETALTLITKREVVNSFARFAWRTAVNVGEIMMTLVKDERTPNVVMMKK